MNENETIEMNNTPAPENSAVPGNENGPAAPAPKAPRMKLRYFLSGMLAGVLIAGVLFCIVMAVYVVGYSYAGTSSSSAGEANGSAVNDDSIAKLKKLESMINKTYYYNDEVTTEQKEDGMYKGLLDSLDDPYSVYYDEEEMKELTESTEGVYYGIGAYVTMDTETDYPMISGVIKNSPAEAAELSAGDLIIEVNGEDVYGMDLDEAVALIRGEEGTDVSLKIYREGETDYLDITVTRAKVDTETVSYEMKDEDNKIGYIEITEFDDVTANQFKEALTDLKDQGMKGLILDLRSNPGGNVDTVVDIANELLPEGLVFYYKEADGSETDFTADGANEFKDPLVVLVNGYSASASEILSGAIQDSGIGTILGTQTYGKGVVQSVYDLGDGTAVKITTAAYFTRNGRDINHKGITPDEVLEFDMDAYREDKTDNQLDRALEIIEDKLQ